MPPKRPLARKRQTKLSFSPATNASPKPKPTFTASSDDSDDGPSPSRPAKRQRLGKETRTGMKLGMPVTQNKRGMFGSSDLESSSSGSSSEAGEGGNDIKVKPSPKGVGRQAKTVVISDEDEEVQPSSRKRKRQREPTPSGSSESDSVGEVVVVPRKDMRRRNKPTEDVDKGKTSQKNKKSRAAKRASTRKEDLSGSESEDEVTVVSGRKKTDEKKASKERKARQSKKDGSRTKQKPSPPVESSEHDSEDDMPVVTPRKSNRKQRKLASESSENEAPKGKRLAHRKKRQASTPEEDSNDEDQDEESNDEADELKEELAFLQSSPPGLGSTQSKTKTAREKALEAMKKRRAANSDPPSSSAVRKKPIVVDSESESDLEIIPEEQEQDSEENDDSDESEEAEYGGTAEDVLYGSDEDDDFINDEDAPIGMPSEHALPLQFSSLRNAKARDLFKYAIEWMVQKKINPAFASDDEIYTMTFRKLDDEVNGLASSKYHSSVWTKEFTRAIRARPEMVANDIDPRTRAIMEPHCEACNRKSHTASYEMSFTGKPYQKETLEPLAANASDSDSESNSDSSDISSTGSEEALNGEKPTYNESGERIPPESKVFTLGSTCQANAQVAHTLYHWRYHLNSWVVDYLIREGHCSTEKIVARDKWSVRKREKLANKVVDEMEKSGEIKKLHRMYRDQVNYALEADNDYRKGWGRKA